MLRTARANRLQASTWRARSIAIIQRKSESSKNSEGVEISGGLDGSRHTRPAGPECSPLTSRAGAIWAAMNQPILAIVNMAGTGGPILETRAGPQTAPQPRLRSGDGASLCDSTGAARGMACGPDGQSDDLRIAPASRWIERVRARTVACAARPSGHGQGLPRARGARSVPARGPGTADGCRRHADCTRRGCPRGAKQRLRASAGPRGYLRPRRKAAAPRLLSPVPP